MNKEKSRYTGLVPVWEFSICAGVNEDDLIESLRNSGVPLLEISIANRTAAFAKSDDLTSFIYRNSFSQLNSKNEGFRGASPSTPLLPPEQDHTACSLSAAVKS